jgi:hypothetical protein
MNERIKELYQEAIDICQQLDEIDANYDGTIDQEFAKLIVMECSNFLKDTLDDHFAAEQLEEHFGVKE